MKTKVLLMLLSLGLIYSCSKDSIEEADVTLNANESSLAGSSINSSSTSTATTDNPNQARSEDGDDYKKLIVILQQGIEYQDDFTGKTVDVSNFTLSEDDKNLYFVFNNEDDWILNETYLYVGDESEIPMDERGNLILEDFPHYDEHGHDHWVETIGNNSSTSNSKGEIEIVLSGIKNPSQSSNIMIVAVAYFSSDKYGTVLATLYIEGQRNASGTGLEYGLISSHISQG